MACTKRAMVLALHAYIPVSTVRMGLFATIVYKGIIYPEQLAVYVLTIAPLVIPAHIAQHAWQGFSYSRVIYVKVVATIRFVSIVLQLPVNLADRAISSIQAHCVSIAANPCSSVKNAHQ